MGAVGDRHPRAGAMVMIHPSHDPAPDFGATGPAMMARRSRQQIIGAVSVSTVARGRVIEVKRMGDVRVIDRMRDASQLSERQYDAATVLHTLWTLAGLNPQVSATMRTVRDVVEPPPDDGCRSMRRNPIQLGEDETYRDRHRAIMRMLPGTTATKLDALMMDEHPGVRWLATVQEGLGFLADEWGMEVER